MVAALPGARGLFSVLQDAIRTGDRYRIRLSRRVVDILANFLAIADTLRDRPTRFRELVPVPILLLFTHQYHTGRIVPGD